jgi:mannosyltransferase OCH1-like enzyme
MIPKIIHQIWIQGYNQAPFELQKFCQECRKINFDFQYILWDDDRIKKLLSEHFADEYLQLYNSYTVFAQKADFSRYVILYIYGGIYLDFDTKCKKNLTPFLKYDLFFTTYIYYLTGIIGAKPNHPVFLIALQNIVKRHTQNKNIPYAT